MRAQPALPTRLNLMAASRDDGTTLRSPDGTCLARYKVDHGTLAFAIDDDCMLEQVAAILPETCAYEAGMLRITLPVARRAPTGPAVVIVVRRTT